MLALAAGRRAKWIVLAVWLLVVAGSLAADLPGRFADAERNESASFLPEDAESTKALVAAEALQGGEEVQLIAVFRRDGGLARADRATVAEDRAALEALRGRFPQLGPVSAPVPSRDGTSALLTAAIKTDGEPGTIIDPVEAARAAIDGGGGLEAAVTGSAGFSADAIEVFEGINGTLLIAAFGLVVVLLIAIYRSPLFVVPLIAVGFAELTSRSVGWALTEAGVTVNGQSSSILSVLVLGAGTDYALLLVARYREELRRSEDKHDALAQALRSAGPAIVASGVTVVLALLSLSVAEVNGTAGLGPIGAVGIVVAMLAMLTLLPALLAIVGRRAFWPFIPRVGDEGADATHGAWRRVGERVARSPRRVWAGSLAVLLVCAAGLTSFSTGLTQSDAFRDEVESVQGQELLAKAFPQGGSAPSDVVVREAADVPAVVRALRGVDDVAEVRPVARGEQGTLLAATLELDPYSTEAYALVPDLRRAASAAAQGEVLVGGVSAVEKDLRDANRRDTAKIVPITLVVVLLVLVVLLRALVAPLLLVGTVILSYLAALGVGAVVFDVVFGFPGSDTSLPLYAFVFLVALGIDYNIFLMARVREEVRAYGTRDGMLRGLAVTGGVITSAGVVLAGTFSVLAVLPLVFLTQIGFVIAFGVLLDTFLVRSVLVPALVLDMDDRVWWPSARSRRGVAAPLTHPTQGTR